LLKIRGKISSAQVEGQDGLNNLLEVELVVIVIGAEVVVVFIVIGAEVIVVFIFIGAEVIVVFIVIVVVLMAIYNK